MVWVAHLLFAILFVRRAEGAGSNNIRQHLNYGYSIDAQTPLFISAGKSIFDLSDAEVGLLSLPAAAVRTSSHSSESDMAAQIALQMGVKGQFGIGMFQAAAAGRFNKISSSVFKVEFTSKKIVAEKHKLTLDTFAPYTKLTAAAKVILETADPSTVFDKLGQFYAESVTLGGLFVAEYVTEVTKKDTKSNIELEVTASFTTGAAAGTLNTGIKTETRKGLKTHLQSFRATCLGGDASLWLGLTSQSKLDQIQVEWSKSVNDDTLYPVKVTLKPIWALLEDNPNQTARVQQLKAHSGSIVEQLREREFKPSINCAEGIPQFQSVTCRFKDKAKACDVGSGVLVPASYCMGARCPTSSGSELVDNCDSTVVCHRRQLTRVTVEVSMVDRQSQSLSVQEVEFNPKKELTGYAYASFREDRQEVEFNPKGSGTFNLTWLSTTDVKNNVDQFCFSWNKTVAKTPTPTPTPVSVAWRTHRFTLALVACLVMLQSS